MDAAPPSVPAPSPLLVLFDCDGTLVDSQHMIVAAMTSAHALNGIALPSRERLLSVVGLSLNEAFLSLSGGAAGYPVAAMAEAYRDAYLALRERAPMEPLFPDAREVIAALRARPEVTLGIVTGKARRGVDRLLAAHDMEGWFATIQTADDAPSKPHPAMVQQALRAVGALPEETVVVGDTTYDVLMALQAGASALGVTWGYHKAEDLRLAGAHRLVDAFSAVPGALAAITAARAASGTP